MDPYWLFFKTVVHTIITLMSAAAMLFTAGPTPDHPSPRRERASVRRASLPIEKEASFSPRTSLATQASELNARLHDNNPAERAKAACEARKLGDGARPLMQDLLIMLADDAQVPGDVCGDWGHWSGDPQAFQTTPGEKAAAALVTIGSAACEPLISVLRSPQWPARKNAAWALGALDDSRAVGPLIATLRDGEAPVRGTAAWALGALDDARAVPGLSRALVEDHEAKVRSQAAWALGAIGDNRASGALAAALKDTDPKVRRQAAWALGVIED